MGLYIPKSRIWFLTILQDFQRFRGYLQSKGSRHEMASHQESTSSSSPRKHSDKNREDDTATSDALFVRREGKDAMPEVAEASHKRKRREETSRGTAEKGRQTLRPLLTFKKRPNIFLRAKHSAPKALQIMAEEPKARKGDADTLTKREYIQQMLERRHRAEEDRMSTASSHPANEGPADPSQRIDEMHATLDRMSIAQISLEAELNGVKNSVENLITELRNRKDFINRRETERRIREEILRTEEASRRSQLEMEVQTLLKLVKKLCKDDPSSSKTKK